MNSVVFTGLPRDITMFQSTVSGLNILKEEKKIIDKIVFATWKNQMTPEYWNVCNRYKVQVLEKTEPEYAGSGGHFFYQCRALENGLKECNPDNYVMKLRTDTWIDRRFVEKLITNPDNYLSPYPSDIFIRKVWIPYAEITKPFYMPDELFYGHHEDISKLFNYEMKYETMQSKDGGGETHIRRFVDPFIEKFPIFELMIKKVSEDSFMRLFAPERFSLLKKRLNQDWYLELLAYYYFILHKYFKIWNEPGVMKWYQPYCEPKIQLEREKFIENFHSSKSFLGQRIFCYDYRWIDDIVNGNFPKSDEIGEKMYKKIKGIKCKEIYFIRE